MTLASLVVLVATHLRGFGSAGLLGHDNLRVRCWRLMKEGLCQLQAAAEVYNYHRPLPTWSTRRTVHAACAA